MTDPRLSMRERDLEEHVREICADLGVIYVHHGRSVQVVKGWVDDVLIGCHGVLFRELKTTTGTVSRAQTVIIDRLQGAGMDVAVWRPADLISGAIARQVAAISRVRDRVALPAAGEPVEVPLGDGCRLQLQRLADGHVWVSVESDTDRAHVTLGPGVQRLVAEFLRGRPVLRSVGG